MVHDSESRPGVPAPPPGTRVAAVVSTFHERLTGAMLESARATLAEHGLTRELLVVRAPGAFELPLVARRLAMRDDVDAVLCFGLVLTGETTHDVHVAGAAAQGILRASLDADKPVLFGVLTCQTLEQAEARALPGGPRDKGREVALAALGALDALRRAGSEGRTADAVGFGAAGGARS